MDVIEAIATRFSCRAFLDKPVAESMVRDILVRAARAPSGGNLQPWCVHVLAGKKLAALKALIKPRSGELPQGEGTAHKVYPPKLTEPYRTRRFVVGELLYDSVGISRGDRTARLRQLGYNFEFFGAPVGLFFSIDRSMGPLQWTDLGMYIYAAMLLARSVGLESCAQGAWGIWHRTVSAFLHLPSDHILVCGMALGYGNPEATINHWRAPRALLDEFAVFFGFEGEAEPHI
jgi:nitroreductase